MVGLGRVELPTSRLSGVRSNQTELQARSHLGGQLSEARETDWAYKETVHAPQTLGPSRNRYLHVRLMAAAIPSTLNTGWLEEMRRRRRLAPVL